jgi:hypothetical protein
MAVLPLPGNDKERFDWLLKEKSACPDDEGSGKLMLI